MKKENIHYKWVSVEEELPEVQDINRVGCKYFSVKVDKYGEGMGFYSTDGQWHRDYSAVYSSKVTHWLKEIPSNRVVEFETSDFPASHHILLVDKDGNLIEQVNIRDGLVSPKEFVIATAFKNFARWIENGDIEIEKD